MIDLFYLKHRWTQVLRSPGLGGTMFAALVLGILMLVVNNQLSESWMIVKQIVSDQIGLEPDESPYWIVHVVVLSGFLAKVLLPKSVPNIHYYHTLNVKLRDLKVGYMLDNVFSLWVLLLLGLEAWVAHLCLNDLSIGWAGMIGSVFVWLTTVFLSLYVFACTSTRVTGAIVAGVIILQFLIYEFPDHLLHIGEWKFVFVAFLILVAVCSLAYRQLTKFFDFTLTSGGKTFVGLKINLNLFKDPLMQLEFFTMMRNKRARGTTILGIFLIPYFLVLGGSKALNNEIYLMMICLMISGLLIFQMGTYIFAWEGSFFDLLMSRFTARQFIEHKYRFFTYTSLFFSILMSVSVYLTYQLSIFLPLACFVYNIGWNIPLVINNGFKNTEKIDLTRGVFMNYQGFNSMVMITALLSIVPPIILYSLFRTHFGDYGAIIGLASVGLVGVALRPVLIDRLSKKLENKKHYLSTCYRS